MSQPAKIKTLIVAAYNNELNHFCKMGRKYLTIKNNIAFLSAGIGPVAASFGLTHFLEDYRPEVILSVGTAGIIKPKYNIGDMTIAKSAAIVSGSSDVYSPKKAITLHLTTKNLVPKYSKKLKDFNKVSVFCPQEITKTTSRQGILLKKGYDVENLEAYAFAYVAKKFRIPFISVLGLTNYVGPKAHQEWKKNEDKVCKKISTIIKKLIS